MHIDAIFKICAIFEVTETQRETERKEICNINDIHVHGANQSKFPAQHLNICHIHFQEAKVAFREEHSKTTAKTKHGSADLLVKLCAPGQVDGITF